VLPNLSYYPHGEQRIIPADVFNGTIFENLPFVLIGTVINSRFWEAHPNYGIDYISWTFDSMPVLEAYLSHSPETVIELLSHDLMHAVDFYLNDQSHRLFKINFGMGRPTRGWTIAEWRNEARVIAMQNGALFNGNIHARWSRYHPEMSREEYCRDSCKNHLCQMLDPSAGKEVTRIADRYIDETFDYWREKRKFLHAVFLDMINFMDAKRPFEKLSA